MLNEFLIGMGDVCFPARRGQCFGEPSGGATPISQSEEGLELQGDISGSQNSWFQRKDASFSGDC